MTDSKYFGRRYVCLVRCSTSEQADTSIPDQLALLHAFAARHGMVSAGNDILLGGVSGSRPGARTDIQEVLDRKRIRDDFDILLIQDLSRLTRGGVEHGSKIEYDLSAAGIDLVFASGSLPEGDHAGIVKSVEYFAAQQHAKAISFSVARGQMSSIEDGRMAHCLRPPYGVDRKYIGLDGKPVHIPRNLPSGIQQRLHPESFAVLEMYPKPEKGKASLHYRKQKSERIVLIPGESSQIETIRHIFRRKLIDRWGHWRIAKELNDKGIPSPNGKAWSMQTVKMLLRNPVYVRRGIANRRTDSVYNSRAAGQPKAKIADRKHLASHKRPKGTRRPKADWIEQHHPELENFLGPELQPLAEAFQGQFLTGDLPVQSKDKPDKHVDSLFVLKQILKSKQGSYAMTGRTRGMKMKPYRYYQVAGATRRPTSDPTIRRQVRAEPIEQAVLTAVREILLSSESLRPQIEAEIRKQIATIKNDGEQVSNLFKQRTALKDKLNFLLEELDAIGQDAVKDKLRQLQTQLKGLDERVAKAAMSNAGSTIDVGATVDHVLKRLAAMGRSMETLPAAQLRALLATIIDKLEVDLVTGEVELELALPNWAAFDPKAVETRVGLDENFLQTSIAETQDETTIALAKFDCQRPSKGCYRCRRAA